MTNLQKHDFIKQIKVFVAKTSLPPSSTRNIVGKGGLQQIREWLVAHIDLSKASTYSNKEAFEIYLDRNTNKLAAYIRDKTKDDKNKNSTYWGPARKYINIYLRSCTYNYFLRQHFCLDKIDTLLELPIDSKVANELRKKFNQKAQKLDKFVLTTLLKTEHSLYQQWASADAKEQRINPVDLDVFYWP